MIVPSNVYVKNLHPFSLSLIQMSNLLKSASKFS